VGAETSAVVSIVADSVAIVLITTLLARERTVGTVGSVGSGVLRWITSL
jgi:hypothetical protein